MKKKDTLLSKIMNYFENNSPQTLNDDNPIVSHYCSYDSAINILESKSLWFTDHRYMNDPTEIKYALSLVMKIIECDFSDIPEFVDFKKNFFEYIDKYYTVLLCCFLKKQDYMPGWRYYGNNGQGVAINFYKDKLIARNKLSSHDVVYEKGKQEAFLKGIVELYIAHPNRKENLQNLFLGLSMILQSIKIIDYADECEWRIASPHLYLPKQNLYVPTDLPIQKLITSRIKPTYEILEFEYSSIQSITLGPSCDYDKNKNILKKLFYDLRIDVININHSKRSYRHDF
ncbi:TPA: DUF2971 domain-containing protein [Legionella pneumophila]|nr:DUF2971 domain-containing protein [Legionella pneumophila]